MKNLAILALLFLLAQCREKEPQPSMSDGNIAALIADICLAESATTGLQGIPKDSLSQVYFRQVYAIHKTTYEEHKRNIEIICQDVDRMERILAHAEQILKEKK